METENKLRKVLFNEVTAVVALVGIIFGVINWVNSPVNELNLHYSLIEKDISSIQENIGTINDNHMTHLQGYAEEIKDLKKVDSSQLGQIADINIKLERILTILER